MYEWRRSGNNESHYELEISMRWFVNEGEARVNYRFIEIESE